MPAPAGHAVPCLPLGDTIFADDLAVCVQGSDARHVGLEVGRVAGQVLDTFSEHGLTPSMGPSKTAAIVSPMGPGAREARRRLYVEGAGKIPVLREYAGMVSLSMVHQYKHLGAILHHRGTLGAELRHRLALARVAFKEGKRTVYACKLVDVRRRAALFQSKVLSTLFYGAGAWPRLQVCEFRALDAGFVSLCRQVLCIPKSEDQRWSTSQILAAAGFPALQDLLHAERLRFLVQLVRNAPDVVWAVGRCDEGFLAAQTAALRWMHALICATTPLRPAGTFGKGSSSKGLGALRVG